VADRTAQQGQERGLQPGASVAADIAT
jgi:hypothetical protein